MLLFSPKCRFINQSVVRKGVGKWLIILNFPQSFKCVCHLSAQSIWRPEGNLSYSVAKVTGFERESSDGAITLKPTI